VAGKTLDITNILTPDQMAVSIANTWMEWDNKRQSKKADWDEVRRYIVATDTTHTSNSKNPWSNKTTLPKLCQIRDNLLANYMATLFPKKRWLDWEGDDKKDETKRKKSAIKDYMTWAINQPHFKQSVTKCLLDWIDTGNTFATVEWVDQTSKDSSGVIRAGFVGPRPVRISPLDIVFNPIASSFRETPKITRSLMTRGEAKEALDRMSITPDDKAIAEGVWNHMMDCRHTVAGGSWEAKDSYLSVDGFDNYLGYLGSQYVELLTFQGDFYNDEDGTVLKNHIIVVMDRAKIILKRPHSYPLPEIPVFHAGWRIRQDNLWAMGPLDNLVGLQYRLDHVENMKSDILDLVTYPPLAIKGNVNEFTWGPLERIYLDQDGQVELLSPDVNALQVNIEINSIEQRMEEMAGAPKEAMGVRTPGEKTMYEVQRLENAASRIFQSKIREFEEHFLEPLLNAMLVYAQKYLDATTIRVIDDEFRGTNFKQVTAQDLSANGRLKPVGARHFAEKAELIQNLSNFFQSPLGQDQAVSVHFSGIRLARLVEEALEIGDYSLVEPFIRLSEQADAQKLTNAHTEEVAMEADAPAGLTPDDHSGDQPVSGGDLNLG